MALECVGDANAAKGVTLLATLLLLCDMTINPGLRHGLHILRDALDIQRGSVL